MNKETEYPVMTLIDTQEQFLLKLDEKELTSITGYEIDYKAKNGDIVDVTLHLTVKKQQFVM